MVVFLALKRLNPIRQSHIRLVLDNQVVVHCLNQRGSRSRPINLVMIAIFLLARRRSWEPVSLSPGRISGCSSRRPFQISPTGIRVVTGPIFFPLDIQPSAGPSSGPIRHGIQPQTSVLRSPQPGSPGLGNGCSVVRLEPVGKDLPLSSGQLSPKGSPQAEILQGEGGPSGSQSAEEQSVSSPNGTRAPSP